MTILILPAAGRSSRYSLGRPKFLLEHPAGGSMITWATKGLLSGAPSPASIMVISLSSFFDDYSVEKLKCEMESSLKLPVEIILLAQPTNSMVESVLQGISSIDHDPSIIIRDCDSFILFDENSTDIFSSGNFVGYGTLSRFPKVRAANKSFVVRNTQNTLRQMREKIVSSEEFGVGCVGFSKASDFISASSNLKGTRELYVSDVVNSLISEGQSFECKEAIEYDDWGTQDDWINYKRKFRTLFIDLDGVVFTNSGRLNRLNDWTSVSRLDRNVDLLLKIQENGKCQFIFTTSRSEEYREVVRLGLENIGFDNFQLIMGLFHAQRILINDFADSNPYPSATSISIARDEDTLSYFLKVMD